MHREAARSREAGFTLVEALIAMVVLSFGLIAVTNLLLVASTSNSVANRSTMAAAQAMEEMERLKSLTFDDPLLAAGGDLDNPQAGYSRNVVIGPPTGTGTGTRRLVNTWLITDVPAVGTRPIKFITVQSEEQSALGRQLTRAQFTTFRTRWQ
jgi:Tfp pilus assembly protein PilV